MNRADLLRSASVAAGALAVGERPGAVSAAAPNAHDEALDRFLAEQWRAYHRRHPEAASLDGDREYDDRWDDPSAEAAAAEAAEQRSALAALERIDPAPLSATGRLNRRLYAEQLRDAIRGFELRTYLFALNQRGGVQTDVSLPGNLPFATRRDYEAWAARVERWPRKVDAAIGVLREAVAQRMLWPRVVMERVPAQLDRQLVAPESHPFFEPFARVPAAVAPADAERLRGRVRAAIADGVLPALRRLRAFLTDTYLPAAPVDVGVGRVPNGAAIYAYLLHLNTTTNATPEAIHALGEHEVARVRAEMERVAPRTGYRGSLADVFRAMREDPKNAIADAGALLDAYRALAKRIDPELVRFFRVLPRTPYGVAPIPASVAPDATTAYYQPLALDGSRAGTYCVNLYRPDQRPVYEMPVLTLHEAVPGHHLQFALAAELGTLPDFRRSAYYVGYSEGWGLYAESLGDAMGLYDDPKAKMGALSYEMWRAVRLVVDTGMHAFGWSRDRAIAYFLDNAAKTKLDVVNEIDRYITDPGQAPAYKVGQLKILELRDRARAKLGAAFDLRDFHAVVLGAGSLPLDVLEERVDAWLTKT
ncbi:MAG TPA: DUF885 domain-containing protein [Candidatus Elarobacter sp.]|jgi:uncharacterized protein (DUF885 family)|nr:DUF885 domain-containing protein [Candidatus Elarobacter sp.]